MTGDLMGSSWRGPIPQKSQSLTPLPFAGFHLPAHVDHDRRLDGVLLAGNDSSYIAKSNAIPLSPSPISHRQDADN